MSYSTSIYDLYAWIPALFSRLACYNETMKKKSESFRTIGHISWRGIPIEMQMTKKGELRFLERGKEIKDPARFEQIVAYLKEANQ